VAHKRYKGIFRYTFYLITCNVQFLQGVNNFYWKINKCPHITLASLKAMISDLMTDLDRDVVIHSSKKFQSWI
jgi:hypothetical protein